MTQYGIINNIINTWGIYGYNHSTTHTAVQYTLVTYEMKNTTQYQDQWKYSSSIIIKMYVTSNACQNIAFYVHQCAKTNHNPKHSYEKEFLSICHYLQCNLKDGKRKGLVIRHPSNMAVDCYIYADFTGCMDQKNNMTQYVSNQELDLQSFSRV